MATKEAKIGDIFKHYRNIGKMYNQLIKYELEGLKKGDPKVRNLWILINDERVESERLLLSRPLTDGYYNQVLQNMVTLNSIKPFDRNDYLDYNEFNLFKRFAQHLYEIDLQTSTINIDGTSNTQDYFVINGKEYSKEDAAVILAEQYGEEATKEYMDEVMNLDKDKKEKVSKILNQYYDLTDKIETHIFIAYLQKAIDEETNPQIKESLIRTKYALISTFRALEITFILDLDLDVAIHFNFKDLAEVFQYIPDYYDEFIDWHKTVVKTEEDVLLERNKVKYENIEEQTKDILRQILIKTHISSTPNPEIRKTFEEDTDAAVELVQSSIDKKVLVKAKNINPKFNYTISIQ